MVCLILHGTLSSSISRNGRPWPFVPTWYIGSLHQCTIIVLVRKFEREMLDGYVTSVTVIIKMGRGCDVEWRIRDIPANLLSMGRKTYSFIDHCKKLRKAFWIILSLKCSWKTLLTRYLNSKTVSFKTERILRNFSSKNSTVCVWCTVCWP